jgi:hypothetical protein
MRLMSNRRKIIDIMTRLFRSYECVYKQFIFTSHMPCLDIGIKADS